MAPPHQISLWLDHDASAWVQGLSLGIGARYTASAFSTQDNLRKTPGYTLVDLAVRYEAKLFDVDLGVSNLLDRNYYGVCYDGYGCAKGEGRVVTLTVSRQF